VTEPHETPDIPYGVIVVELDDVVPRRHPDLPNLYVAGTDSSLEDRYRFLERPEGKEWFRGHVVSPRLDLSVPLRPIPISDRKALRVDTTRHLRSQGFTVNRYTRVWTVYVVELEPAANTSSGRGVLYVGETSRTPEERFAQHMNQERTTKGGRLHSNVVTRYGKRLRMDLAPTEQLFDRDSAKLAEAAWAEHLRTLGYVVEGGH
jgi:hypothetical protein